MVDKNYFDTFYDLMSAYIKDVGQVPLVKEAIIYQLLADKIHIFVCGDPGAGAKSSFRYILQKMAPAFKYYSYSGHSTKVGMSQKIQRLRKGILHVDEIGMAGGNDVNILRDVMQNQKLAVDKHKKHESKEVPINVYATSNPKAQDDKWNSYGNPDEMREQIPISNSMYRRFHISIFTRDYNHDDFDTVNRYKVRDDDRGISEEQADEIRDKILELRKYEPKFYEKNGDDVQIMIPDVIFEWLKVCKEFDGEIVMPVTNELAEGVKEVAKARARLRESEEVTNEDWEATRKFFHKTFKTGGLNNRMIEDKLEVEM